MKRCLEILITSVAVLIAFAAVRVATGEQEAPRIENLRLPLEFYDDGTVKRQLQAGVARVPAKGPIDARKVKVECFDRTGALELIMISDKCSYDREAGTAKSSEDVKVAARGLLISGKGFTWESNGQTVDIHENCRVVFNRRIKELGRKNADKK
ncbi:MAG: hypothetical protein QGH15_10895 [Kiritimatiellia bacterium]|jgi:hypothetical protein|nr:hypothetical protein [Kiritimatiellia bacterium]